MPLQQLPAGCAGGCAQHVTARRRAIDHDRPVTRGRKQGRLRLDTLLVDRGLVESREKARALILAGAVTVDGNKALKAGELVAPDAEVGYVPASPWVSRGGLKLVHALERFEIDPGTLRMGPCGPTGCVALDAGASTGGFTDVLLQHGANRVYAVDVGYGQLHWKLRSDPRVVVLERTNVRYLRELPEPVDLVTADLSFISLSLVLPGLIALATEDATYLLLVKPQFEAGRAQVGKGGVVRDPAVHRSVLVGVAELGRGLGLRLSGLTASPVLGPAGNVEFLAWFQTATPDGAANSAPPSKESAERIHHDHDHGGSGMLIENALEEARELVTARGRGTGDE